MPWTDTARREYRRETDRYASDLTDREWELIAPFMPPKRIGRPRKVDMREVVNALLYIEPRRVCRRLQFLRGWSYGKEEEDIEAVFC